MTDVAPMDPAAQPEPAAAAPSETPAPEATAPAPAPAVAVGAVVAHTWTDPTGEHTAYGLVIAVHADPEAADRAEVVWFKDRSGPIAVDELEVVKD